MRGRLYKATWSRFFAAMYDRAVKGAEEAGLADRRHELVGHAKGATLEIGAGTGLNLRHYTDAVTDLVLTEPSDHMVRQLRDKVTAQDRPAEVVQTSAESLPFEDGRFDTVVSTLVLCTVPSTEAAIAEAARVLKPGGQLLFLEHIRSDDPGLAGWQDRLHGPWILFADGCHCNRDTLGKLGASALTVEDVEHGELPKAAPLVKPMVTGSAVRAGD